MDDDQKPFFSEWMNCVYITRHSYSGWGHTNRFRTSMLQPTIDDILSFNSLFAQGLHIILVHSHTPVLRLQILGIGVDFILQLSIM